MRLSPPVTATITVATDDTLSDVIDLGSSFTLLIVSIPTLTSCQVSLHTKSLIDNSTYHALGDSANTETTTGGYTDVFRVFGQRYLKIKTSASQGNDRVFVVQGMEE